MCADMTWPPKHQHAQRPDQGVEIVAHDRAVQPAAQLRRVARLGFAARTQLTLELPNEHVHTVLVNCL